jgi:hypothetical protein
MKAEGRRRKAANARRGGLAAFCLPLSAFAIVGLFMRQHTAVLSHKYFYRMGNAIGWAKQLQIKVVKSHTSRRTCFVLLLLTAGGSWKDISAASGRRDV